MSSSRDTVFQVLSAPTVIDAGALPGVVMLPSTVLSVGVLAVVAGRGDDDQAAGDGVLRREAERIERARLLDLRMAERQIDDADRILRAVGDDPLDAGNDVAGVAEPCRCCKHAHVDEMRAGRDAALIERRRTRVSEPAMMPAMCVPWPNPSVVVVSPGSEIDRRP